MARRQGTSLCTSIFITALCFVVCVEGAPRRILSNLQDNHISADIPTGNGAQKQPAVVELMTIDGQHFQRRLTQVGTGHTVVDPATAAATPPSSSYNSLGELSSATAAAAAASAAGAGQSAPAPEAGGPGRVSASSTFSTGIISAIQTAVTKNVAAIARAAFKSVTYPETNGYQPYQGDLQYSQINGQVPFRYEEKAGSPPRIRTGYYFLPSGWYNTSLPVMMLFHGLAGFGVSILNAGSQGTFQDMASKYKFIIVAPDSRTADFTGWSVPTADEPPSADMLHAQACLEFVLNLPFVKYDAKHVVAAGVSNGGAMPAPVASRYSIYTHAMILHARFYVSELQTNIVPIWISTGIRDNEYPPVSVERFAAYFQQAAPKWPPITYNVGFNVGHTLEDPLERIDAINWWLGLGSYTEVTSAAQISIWANEARG